MRYTPPKGTRCPLCKQRAEIVDGKWARHQTQHADDPTTYVCPNSGKWVMGDPPNPEGLEAALADAEARLAHNQIELRHQESRLAAVKEDVYQAANAVASDEEETTRLRLLLAESTPVDRSKQCTTSGETPEAVRLRQQEEGSDRQHDSYIVLCAEERAKGFVRPYRDAYRHLKCGKITTMGRALSETYARDPGFYTSTFCCHCNSHFPVGEDGEFTWYEMDGREGPKVGT